MTAAFYWSAALIHFIYVSNIVRFKILCKHTINTMKTRKSAVTMWLDKQDAKCTRLLVHLQSITESTNFTSKEI